MSIVTDVGEQFEHFHDVLHRYEREFSGITRDLKMKGLPMDQALTDHASSVGHYQIRKAELRTLRKYVESTIDRVRAKLWKHYTEAYPRELNYRDKDHYVHLDPKLAEYKTMLHEVSELEEQYDAACEALQQRGYMLNALVKARVAGFDSIMI